MSDSNPSNVIAFTSQAADAPVVRRRDGQSDNDLSAAEGLSLLNQIRDNLVNAVATAFAEKLGAAKRDLAQLADRARDPERADLYRSGYALLANGGVGFLEDFRVTFTRICDGMMALRGSRSGDPWSGSDTELSLVSSTDFERELAVGKLATRAAYDCSQQLTALDRRVGLLAGARRMDSETNPFYPKRLFDAFLDAVGRRGADQRLGLILLETFAHYTTGALPAIYMDLNRQLVAKGVLEKLPIEIEERPHEASARRRVRRGVDSDSVGDVFVQLASGLHRSQRGPVDGTFPGMPSMAGMYPPLDLAAAGPGGAPFTAGPMAMGQVLQGLTGLQRGSQQAASALGVTADDLAEADPTSTEMLKRIGSSPLMRWLQPNEAVTVDLVAMLFDTIFADPDLPEALRPELGRLQVSILKAALLNRGFFNDERHPARRLLDLIANASRGWGKADESRLLAAVHGAVDHVNQAFEDDTSVFTAQIEQIETMLRQADDDARDNVSELVDKLERQDRQVFAEASVTEQVERRLEYDALPTAISEFIDANWRQVMTTIYVEDGDQGAQWQEALTTLDDLIWSITPKPVPEDRRRLMGMLPGLLRRLAAAMARIDRTPQWERFLKRLMSIHMAAVRATSASVTPIRNDVSAPAGLPSQTPKASPGDEEPAADDAPADAADVSIEPDAALAAGLAIDAAEGPEADSQSAEPSNADAFLLAVTDLDIGDWVAFRDAGAGEGADRGEISLRASWISRFSGLYLFTDRRGETARIIPTDELAAALRTGQARMLSSTSLTDRAVGRLLGGGADGRDQAAAS